MIRFTMQEVLVNNPRSYSSSNSGSKSGLDPNWVTGFTDAEGCFTIIIQILNINPLKWKVTASFEINLHSADTLILHSLKSFFNSGNINTKVNSKISVFRVTALKDLISFIIPHFTAYPLQTKKAADFILWAKVVHMMESRQHLSFEGLTIILSHYASINYGVSTKIASIFPNIVPIARPLINQPASLHPQWVSGFAAGDGGFTVNLRYYPNSNKFKGISHSFHIAQHSLDILLLECFISFFNCGYVYTRLNLSIPRCDFKVQDFDSIFNIIIPHFDLYPLQTIKHNDFLIFKEIMFLIHDRKHLTIDGRSRIELLISQLNSQL